MYYFAYHTDKKGVLQQEHSQPSIPIISLQAGSKLSGKVQYVHLLILSADLEILVMSDDSAKSCRGRQPRVAWMRLGGIKATGKVKVFLFLFSFRMNNLTEISHGR